MPLTATQLEQMTVWCASDRDLHATRDEAKRRFFGPDLGRKARYWGGAGEFNARERRFLGFFLFTFTLPDGRHPAEVAAERLFTGRPLADAVAAVRGARYVTAIVTSVLGTNVFFELEDERLEVRSRILAQTVTRGRAVVAHLLPVRPGVWLLGPGWVELPLVFGPNMRANLRQHQTDPIAVELLLQSGDPSERPAPRTLPTFEVAVQMMAEAAKREGRDGMLLSAKEWESLVVRCMMDPDMMAFSKEIISRVGVLDSVDDMNRWLQLAMDIWNATPQPDRGGKSANQIATEQGPRLSSIEGGALGH
ncbi:MAG: hypothetical protein AAB289_02640 [Chloroflexota bacterium]